MFDFHTHNLQAPAREAVINLPRQALEAPASFPLRTDALYCVGIHPWWTAEENGSLMDAVRTWVGLPQIVAVGECGFDRLRGDFTAQEAVFEAHVALSEGLRLPLILHCVRAFDVLLAMRKRLKPSQAWFIHGFAGKLPLAQQLAAAGFKLIWGLRSKPEVVKALGSTPLLLETDDSGCSIQDVARKLGLPDSQIATADEARRLLGVRKGA